MNSADGRFVLSWSDSQSIVRAESLSKNLLINWLVFIEHNKQTIRNEIHSVYCGIIKRRSHHDDRCQAEIRINRKRVEEHAGGSYNTQLIGRLSRIDCHSTRTLVLEIPEIRRPTSVAVWMGQKLHRNRLRVTKWLLVIIRQRR